MEQIPDATDFGEINSETDDSHRVRGYRSPTEQLASRLTHLRGGVVGDIDRRLRDLVPGGAHTYAKGADQYPEGMAPVIRRGLGSHVWDTDGREYIEYGMGLRAVSLGHGHPEVNDAVKTAIDEGLNFVRPSLLELEAAESFLATVPGADMVKFAKNGSDVTTAAVKVARAVTGRARVVVCGGFISVDDWWIGSTTLHGGIPDAVRELTHEFAFNDSAGLEDLFARYRGEIACVIMEGEREEQPAPGFLDTVRDLCHRNGALFVLDEMVAGRRLAIAGAQELHQITPDLSTFGKALANGFSVSALAGKREYLEIGSLENRDDSRVFLLSTTHGAESTGLAALLKTTEIYLRDGVIEHLHAVGAKLRQGVEEVIAEAGLSDHVMLKGRDSNLVYATLDRDRQPSQEFRTLLMQELIGRGILAPSLVVSAAHTDQDVEQTVDAFGAAMVTYAKALEGDVANLLEGRPVRPVFPPH